MSLKFIFTGFRSLSEFVPRLPDGKPKRRGDCGPLGVLLCLHVRDPKRWPLTPAALDALNNDMLAKGYLMNASGESNIPGLDKYLSAIGVPHETVGYQAFTHDALHTQLKALDTAKARKLVLVEWSAAGKGLHDDEPGVAFHYSSFGGIVVVDGHPEQSGYYRGDGDSSTDDWGGKPTDPILTGWDAIEAAKPIAFIAIDPPAAVASPPPPVPPADDEVAEAKTLADLKAQIASLQGANAALTQQVTALRDVVQPLVTMVTVLSGFLTAVAGGGK